MPTSICPYITFDGNCEEAVKFWGEALGADVKTMRMGDSPMPVPPEAKQHVMHATIKTESLSGGALACSQTGSASPGC